MEKQYQVIQWWNNGRNYHEGLILLSQYSNNKILVHTLSKQGKENLPAMQDKLAYELTKSVSLDWKNLPKVIQPAAEKPVPEKIPDVPVMHHTDAPQEDLDQYPHIIRKIKYQYSDLYKQRSIKHRDMRSIPDENSEQNTLKRATLLGQIKQISAQMDHLHRFIKDYETSGNIPPEEIVWPPEPKIQSVKLPEDVAELRKMKKHYQSANSRDNNLLLYQTKTKAENLLPMPKGPKKTKIEYRIKQRLRVIEQIKNKLMQMEHAD